MAAPPPPAKGSKGQGGKGRWVKFGEVGVDSAVIAITDPAFTDKDWQGRINYDSLAGPYGHMGVQMLAGFGDGGYEVWGWIVDYGEGGETDERIAQVVITLIDEQRLAQWREE
jgi:hypothetical protein